MKKTIGIVGARGHVGAELLQLVAQHPSLELAFVSSRELDGLPVRDRIRAYGGEVAYRNLSPKDVGAAAADVVILALPNGMAASFAQEIPAGTVIVDLSADFRFDDGWYYGLPELTRERYRGEKRIANPGCYATAMQLALAPIVDLLDGPAQCFGVSGYSGAGTAPSDKNDEEKLRDNLMPYSLANHVHEREVSRQLGRAVEFMPHVAPHFRGITMTVNAHLSHAATRDAIRARYESRYAREPLITLSERAPWVSDIAGRHGVEIGGLTLSDDGRRVVVVATLDNLLKGAATQALQNVNLALGFDEREGIPA